MAFSLKKKLTKINFSKGPIVPKYIVIHYTGNATDTAAANAGFFYDTNRGASANYFMDDKYCYQVVKDTDIAWAVGVNYGSNNLFNKVKNHNSISIEMCSKNKRITKATYNNTVSLTKKLMKKYKIPASHVVRHYDVCSKGCPGWKGWIGKDEHIWKEFKEDISGVKTKFSKPKIIGKQLKTKSK